MADYNQVGLLVLSGERILLCREKYSTSRLILPGGCLKRGETILDCLHREIREKLGDVHVKGMIFIGTYVDHVALDDPTQQKTVQIQLYQGGLEGKPTASSEIKELIWFGPDSNPMQLSPIMINKIIPDLFKRALITWTLTIPS